MKGYISEMRERDERLEKALARIEELEGELRSLAKLAGRALYVRAGADPAQWKAWRALADRLRELGEWPQEPGPVLSAPINVEVLRSDNEKLREENARLREAVRSHESLSNSPGW